MATLIGQSNNDILAGGGGDDELFGNGGNDELMGMAGQDRLSGGPGNDRLDGGANTSTAGDIADYSDAAISFVIIDLITGRAEDGQGGIDTLIGIENLIGSSGSDTLLGDNNANGLRGNAGNDILDGRGNPAGSGDIISYFSDPSGVTVDLASGTARDGFGGTDTLRGIEDINGSAFADNLRGDSFNNIFLGLAGNDVMDGLGGTDTVSYFAVGVTGVIVNLATGRAEDGLGGIDTLSRIENITGSAFSDVLTGDDGANLIYGRNGNDAITGGGGVDTAGFLGERAAYTLTATSGGDRAVTDQIVSRDGADNLSGVERLQFSDGVLAFDNTRSDMAGRGYLIYRAAFDRTPDAEGLGYWIRALESGQDYGSVVAASFIASPEFISKYGTGLSNAAFLNLIYQNVLDRLPDAAGTNYWLNEAGGGGLNGGYARSNLLASFAISDENFAAVQPIIADGIWFV